MATTSWPTLTASEFPNGAYGRPAPSIWSTARSVWGSSPATRAWNWDPSWRVTPMPFVPWTTWLFVRMNPSGVKMKPEYSLGLSK